MNMYLRNFLFISLLLTGIPAQGSLITNGDFENTPPGDYLYEQITGWRMQAFGGAEGTFSITSEEKYSGQQSLLIDIRIIAKINNVYVCNHYTSPVSVLKDDSLSFRFYIRSQKAGRKVQARIISSDNTITAHTKLFEVTDAFEEYEIACPILQAGDYGLRLDFGSETGQCWLDNVNAEIIHPVPPATDSSYVFVCSESGSDLNSGTLEAPFRTINRALLDLRAGGTCLIRKGVYYEEILPPYSGTENHPITLSAYNGEQVIISGADIITESWEPWSEDSGIWRLPLSIKDCTQLFMNGNIMSVARWPNMEFHDNWIEDKKWAYTGNGTTFGNIQSDSIAQLNVDLTGGKAFLKIGKGNGCYSRNILEHTASSASFTWDTTRFLGTEYTAEDGDPDKIATHGLIGNRFFVSGRLGLLDAPGEWYHDTVDNWLYFYPPGGLNPNEQNIEYKARAHGIRMNGAGNIHIKGIVFRGCNLEIINSNFIVVDQCRVLYPTCRFDFFNRTDEDLYLCGIRMEGRGNAIKNSEVAWADDRGIYLSGPNSSIENSVVHDCNLHGRHPGAAITLLLTGKRNEADSGMTIRNSTVFNCGGVGIYPRGTHPVNTTGINSFNNGLYCVDVSGYYIPYGLNLNGSKVSYSWFHNMDGIGMRCDSEGRDILVHHNMVWNTNVNCKWEGHAFNIYNNSYLSLSENPKNSGLMLVFTTNAETDLPNFNVKNNITLYRVLHRENLTRFYDIKDNGINFSNNIILQEEELGNTFISSKNPHDWQLKQGGRPVDAGMVIPDITGTFAGIAPDAGAFEKGVEPWVPGANWLPDSIPVPESMPEADVVAGFLRDRWNNDLVIARFRVFANTGEDVFPLQGAELNIENQFLDTDHNGQLMVYLSKGDYDYQVGKWNRKQSGSISISQNGLDFSDTLNFFPSSLVINVLDANDQKPVSNASVILGTMIQVTDPGGTAKFTELPALERYIFSVVKEGYEEMIDSVFLQNDTLFTVLLKKVTTTRQAENPVIRIFPNPANEKLFIEPLQEGDRIEIWDATGRILLNKKSSGDNSIDVSSFHPGSYILIIHSRMGEVRFKFVKYEL